ncbi:MAG: aminotransferase class IV [Jatrophihabitantaceae bacterium]
MTVGLLAVLGVGVLDPHTPVLRADDAGLTRGDGCFEGCSVRTDDAGHSTVDKLDAHLARMRRSAAALELAFDARAWRALIGTALTTWSAPGEAAMKLVLTRGPADDAPSGLLTISPLPAGYPDQRRDGIAVITLSRGTSADAFADAPWLLGGVKTLSYAVNMAAQRAASRHRAHDVIFVSTDGFALEAPTSSVVWSSGRTLHTTPLGATGILGGTTQQLLFERAAAAGWQTEQALGTPADLHRAESLWLIGSVRGPVDVVAIDGTPRARDERRTAEIRGLCGF